MEEKLRLEILADFDKYQMRYSDFANATSRLLGDLLDEQSISVHSITQRCKSKKSLEEKINRPEKRYRNLSDITDVAAVRITTYFVDDVDKVAELIEKEFSVHPEQSVDKRAYDEPDRFGYQSLHYVVSITNGRINFGEYRRFEKLRLEIQIRSILQHAWAEIEHDLGYKSAAGIPTSVRRRFARVAGLLELADEEFRTIRETLNAYAQEVPESIDRDAFSVEIDQTSLRILLETESITKSLDFVVSEQSGCRLSSQLRVDFEVDLRRLKFFGITTIGELEKTASEQKDLVAAFVRYWTRKSDGYFSAGIGLFYLAYVLAWKTQDRARIDHYLTIGPIVPADERDGLTNRILAFDPQNLPRKSPSEGKRSKK
jgi:ppGpp synthetase/RelA/SpoT-type nucleotidyltranferase